VNLKLAEGHHQKDKEPLIIKTATCFHSVVKKKKKKVSLYTLLFVTESKKCEIF
jgi:hypothetical protein